MHGGPLITDYRSLRAALAARRRELKLSQLDVDMISGLQTGYCAKLEAAMKNFGDLSLPCMLGALGVGLVLMPANSAHPESFVETWFEAEKRQKELRKKRAQKAARAWLTKTTGEQRRLWARKAAKARWTRRNRQTLERRDKKP